MKKLLLLLVLAAGISPLQGKILIQTLSGYDYIDESPAKDPNPDDVFEVATDAYLYDPEKGFYYPFDADSVVLDPNFVDQGCPGGNCHTETQIDIQDDQNYEEDFYYDDADGYHSTCPNCPLVNDYSNEIYYYPSTGCVGNYCVPRYVDYYPPNYYVYPILTGSQHGHSYGPYFGIGWGY